MTEHHWNVSAVTVVFLPPLPGEQWAWGEYAAEVAAYHHPVIIVPALSVEQPPTSDADVAAAWVAHCALALAEAAQERHVLLVASGSSGRMLPALGFSQRAARRKVSGYVLVDAQYPRPGVSDWPDAPVTAMCAPDSEAARQAELRGWEVYDINQAEAALRETADEAV